MSDMRPLKYVLKLKLLVKAKTGMHIGGSKEDVEIGGIDNIVAKLKVFKPDWTEKEFYDVPYIPGSSFKGKLRSLLEWGKKDANGNIIALSYNGNPCQCGTCKVCKLFGPHQPKKIAEPVRLRVEDFYPTEGTMNLWERVLDAGYTEIKTENMINRIKGVAEHPRHTERVIAGSEFEGCLTIRLFENDGNGKVFIELLKDAFDMLKDDYLGGSGSRGYGRVDIKVSAVELKEITEDGKYQLVEDENNEVLKVVKNTLKDYISIKEGEKC